MTNFYAQEYNRASDDSTCPLCGGTTYEGKSCSTCFLPVKVIESIQSRAQSPRFVGVLGPSGVGKTVYLGMLLDLLARGECGLHGLAQGPFTLNLHRKLDPGPGAAEVSREDPDRVGSLGLGALRDLRGQEQGSLRDRRP